MWTVEAKLAAFLRITVDDRMGIKRGNTQQFKPKGGGDGRKKRKVTRAYIPNADLHGRLYTADI